MIIVTNKEIPMIGKVNPSSIIVFILSLIFSFQASSQDYRQLRKNADSLYKAKDYPGATRVYLKSAAIADFNLQKKSSLYSAACCYSFMEKKDSAFITLHKAILAGYSDKENLLQSKDLTTLHAEKEWAPLVQSVKEEKKALNKDPRQASLVTTDVHRFWVAYDLAQKDTANRLSIYKRYYFDKASRGMQDYMGLKVRSIRAFVKHYDTHAAFYRAIRNNTLQADSFKPAIYTCFEKLKAIYPQALFPDVYFVMGAYTAGGTVSDAGLLIGINQIAKTDGIPVGELSLWEKNNFNPLQNLPYFISHELIHFQQDRLMKLDDTTTLLPVIAEGMADFLGEMISGKNTNQRLHTWAKGREKRIWQAFTKDMDYNRYSNWMANSDQETPDNPADQGYWIGYQICRAYYINASDKQQAIYDMFHFTNAREFLKKSKWEEMVAAYQ
ncbi:DUF2268 domain-containing putative Zn-dependent protease [Mucilaginibacter sp. OK098]|uniref:gliding motility protein GldB-related protein n=1 Tax=Mucilaginibacter sp. OK098 TaxID=1855297 RepID=UPI000919B1AF|nr:DUF2268 domain-containing putative Zn-dependent protease [Mucilaginibacter sp. OK098]SHN21601.1 Predicted Zn-dependent protease [Mucilaginibacter sp. OK098]